MSRSIGQEKWGYSYCVDKYKTSAPIGVWEVRLEIMPDQPTKPTDGRTGL